MLRIRDELLAMDDPCLQSALAAIYGSKMRPMCDCRPVGVEMYIAKIVGKFIVKRMPNTGADHAPACDSYEPPPELSGLGEVLGSAIEENAVDGTTTLKLDFSLARSSGKKVPSPGTSEKDSVATDGNKLTLRGMLHYLWEQAGFNRWMPSMESKRSWSDIRKYLLLAAENKRAKGTELIERLYIPEPFSAERKGEIAQRRVARLSKAAVSGKGGRQMMIVVGEIAQFGTARYGYKIRFRHVPDCDFMMKEDLHKRLHKRFASELELWSSNADKGAHLTAIATFLVGPTGIPSIEEIALMTVSSGWIPFESQFELTLLELLVNSRRRFMKGLRYNLAASTPLAVAVLLDTQPQATALYIVPYGVDDAYLQKLAELIEGSKLGVWKWELEAADMPVIPAAVTRLIPANPISPTDHNGAGRDTNFARCSATAEAASGTLKFDAPVSAPEPGK